jgi:SpoVK/Ycf46/Vps4 family AAA+-type ATPase
MNVNEIDSFIQYLDKYKNKQNLNFTEISNIIDKASDDYFKNYSSPKFVGDYHLLQRKFNNSCIENLIYDSYYPPYNTTYNPDCYINMLQKTNINKIQEKTKVDIQTSVTCLKDLIDIINNNVYKETEEYNIDLKLLTLIKDELNQLYNMIGMEELKTSILNQLLYFIQNLHITKSEGENKYSSEFKHTVISGPPGTGKTEIAKILGKMYSKIGILNKNVFKKVTRNDLVAGYLGQTALKTKAVITECLGGVLFIDEAYSLASNNDLDSYSKECIDTLCEALSDYKDNLMVIIAGYDDELNETFFKANRGLESRFIWRFKIENYSPSELYKIFLKKINDSDWSLDDNIELNGKWFEKNKENFTNYGRDMELLFTYVKIVHSKRIYGKSLDLRKKINMEDMNKGYDLLKKNKKQNKRNPALDVIYI